MRLYKKKKIPAGPLFSIGLFGICFIFFLLAIGNTSEDIEDNELKMLKTAIDKAVVTCYSVEGKYPENIEYLEDNYGIVINYDKYAVIYDLIGNNVKPNVIVAPLETE